jgi:hypothetical protein
MPKSAMLLPVGLLLGQIVFGQRAQDTANNTVKRPFWQDSVLLKTSQILRPVPADYYRAHLPFTCDKEYKMQKALRLPVFIRLGSLEYVNRLEGKNF